jgi:hypothetical protein
MIGSHRSEKFNTLTAIAESYATTRPLCIRSRNEMHICTALYIYYTPSFLLDVESVSGRTAPLYVKEKVGCFDGAQTNIQTLGEPERCCEQLVLIKFDGDPWTISGESVIAGRNSCS